MIPRSVLYMLGALEVNASVIDEPEAIASVMNHILYARTLIAQSDTARHSGA